MIWLETGSFENSIGREKRERELIEEHKVITKQNPLLFNRSDEQSQMAIDYYYRSQRGYTNIRRKSQIQ